MACCGKPVWEYHLPIPLSPEDQETLRRTAEEEVSDCPDLLALLTGIAEEHGLEAAIKALRGAKRVFLALCPDGEIDLDLID